MGDTSEMSTAVPLLQLPAELERGITLDMPQAFNLDTPSRCPSLDESSMLGQMINKAAYQHMERIEYWSQTHKRWLAGRVLVKSNPEECEQLHAYSVQLCFGQVRENVGLDYLRVPLRAGELVEIYTKGRGWVSGQISSNQPLRPTLVGYRVLIDGDDNAIENVPANFLRRTYPAGTTVEVYEGSSIGWVDACVREEVTVRNLCDSNMTGDPSFQRVQPLVIAIPVMLINNEIAQDVPAHLVRRQVGTKPRTRVWL